MQRLGTILLGLVFVLSSGVFGAMLGIVYVRFGMPPASDGWSGIAQGLGGAMVGGLIALGIAAFCVAPLARRGTRALAWGAAAVVGAAGLLFLVLYLTRPHRPSQGGALERPAIPATKLVVAS